MSPPPRRKAAGSATGKVEPGGVQSVRRAIAVLKALTTTDEGLTLTEVCQTVGLAPSTAHRLLTTLQDERFARVDPATGLWSVGVEAFSVGNGFLRARDLVSMARSEMRQLMYDSGETVNLAVEDEGQATYLAQVECREMMRAFAKPGARVPLHCSGVGKALLAAMEPVAVQRMLEERPPVRATQRTLASASQLMTDLEATRARGYAIDDQEQAIGLRCVAAVIRDEHGGPMAAVSLSGPMARITDARVPMLGDLVMRSARAITGRMGGRVGDPAPGGTPT
ncbi:helix-turn-helix domain-containing protein [Roseospira marina]|uniref:Helix-turn-helix domain-containing protein n=1 Tax=Roseospira marina TaxID=140057 RepID=A0A5M6I9R6_9PROT|nr:IclR family transcriptional regulator C-terminal domain-containing protein [Roseospira marina]KAA5605026.1 helix-turn-helix domain-containing protein [Roseospira marina]MBB4314962.1 IclR family acetate operon transcriptional repressor [Roseospira marina]MBB5087962.1 IclR family acetate operon transcriptional repressor [Roseospira marina]